MTDYELQAEGLEVLPERLELWRVFVANTAVVVQNNWSSQSQTVNGASGNSGGNGGYGGNGGATSGAGSANGGAGGAGGAGGGNVSQTSTQSNGSHIFQWFSSGHGRD